MITVYALFDHGSRQIYVGMTTDLERRIKEHKRGKSFFTRRFKEFKLIYTEIHPDYASGRVREKYLKSGVGKEFLKTFI
jgi:putative endonuclease